MAGVGEGERGGEWQGRERDGEWQGAVEERWGSGNGREMGSGRGRGGRERDGEYLVAIRDCNNVI